MIVGENEVIYHKLSRHATIILPTKCDRIQYFIRGSRLLLRMAAQSLVAVARSFIDVANYVYTGKVCIARPVGSIIRYLL